MRISTRASWALAGLAVFGTGLAASAQDVRKPASSQGTEWENEFTVYFWMTRLAGDLEIQNVEADVDGDFDDMLKNLDSSIGVHYELWDHDAWGLAADFYRMVLEDDPDVPAGDGELQTRFTLAEALFIGRSRTGQAYLDYFLGLRWMLVDSHFDAPGVDEDRSRNYVDPIVGIRVGTAISRGFHISFRFDIGGFDVGTELSTNLVALGTVYASPTVKFDFGWRSLLFTIDDSDHELDLSVTGPLVSASFGF